MTVSGILVFDCVFSSSGYRILTSRYRCFRRTIVATLGSRLGISWGGRVQACRKSFGKTRWKVIGDMRSETWRDLLAATTTTFRSQPHSLLTMSSPTLRAAILVVSTTAAKDSSTDATGSILNDVFHQEESGKWEVVETKIVGDVVLDIQRTVMAWSDREDAVNVIITTGGTGFAINDITPEV